jgi:hypothetical protein
LFFYREKDLNLVVIDRLEYDKNFSRHDSYGPDYTFANYMFRNEFETMKRYPEKFKPFLDRMRIFKENHKMIGLKWIVYP